MSKICDFFISEDNWRDFIWPSVITIITILASVWLAKREFEKNQRKEKEKIEVEKNNLRSFILRTIKRITDQVVHDEINFYKVFVDNYKIEKGIVPTPMLFSFKELEILNAIDILRFESVFMGNNKLEEDYNEQYLTFSAISILWDCYNKVSEEVLKINSFINDYDTVLLEKYQSIVFIVEKMMIKYAESGNGEQPLTVDHITDLYSILKGYKSEINNFFELHTIINSLDENDFFKQIVETNVFEFNERKSDFLIYYLKYEQEVLLFQNRIKYLIKRIETNRIQLQKFHSKYPNSYISESRI